MKTFLVRFKWPILVTLGVIVASSVLSFVLIQVGNVAEENKELRETAQNLQKQVEEMGGIPVDVPSPGPVGKSGPPGPPGDPGPAGPPGDRGPAGIPGPIGPAGTSGTTGLTGQPGADGSNGTDGQDGQVGPQGPAGDRGPSGPQGPEGPAGAPGADGQDGRTPTHMTCTPTGGLGSDSWECTVTAYE